MVSKYHRTVIQRAFRSFGYLPSIYYLSYDTPKYLITLGGSLTTIPRLYYPLNHLLDEWYGVGIPLEYLLMVVGEH